jgi:hypothetical protein
MAKDSTNNPSPGTPGANGRDGAARDAASTAYGASNIQVLEGLEAVR